MSDLSKRRPQIDFCAGYRAHKRGDPREGCSKAWHEGWDAHAELTKLRTDLAAAREALEKILAIELDKYSHDWAEIEQAQDIARAALKGDDRD